MEKINFSNKGNRTNFQYRVFIYWIWNYKKEYGNISSKTKLTTTNTR